jgi:hypothetical protein
MSCIVPARAFDIIRRPRFPVNVSRPGIPSLQVPLLLTPASKAAVAAANVPEGGPQPGFAKNLLCLINCPFAPFRIGMASVPAAGKCRDLVERDRFAQGQPVSSCPLPNVLLQSKGQDHGAMRMHVVPRVSGPDREVRKINVVRRQRGAVSHSDDQRFALTREPYMDLNITTHQSGYAKSAPEARCPPAVGPSLHPCGRRRQRERMNNPWFWPIRMQHYAVNSFEITEHLDKFVLPHSERPPQILVRRTRPRFKEGSDHEVMQ